MPKAKKLSDEVKMDRRTKKDQREKSRRTSNTAVAEDQRKSERRKKTPRRRQIDPTTCERDYTDDEVEFMRAMDLYKRSSGRMFPTCSEILEVIRDLGYVKQDASAAESSPAPLESDASLTESSVGETV